MVLVGLVVAVPYSSARGSRLFFCRLCPAGALEGAVPNVVQQADRGASRSTGRARHKLAILVAFLVATLFTWRPWCTLFCPLGAIYGLFNQVSLVCGVPPKQCTDCDLCRGQCHYRGHGSAPGRQRRAAFAAWSASAAKRWPWARSRTGRGSC